MRTGYFGTFLDLDHEEETRRRIHELHRAAAREKEAPPPAIPSPRKGEDSYLILFKFAEDRPLTEHVFQASSDSQAVVAGVAWARDRIRIVRSLSPHSSLRISRFRGGRKNSTFEVDSLFAWKGGSSADLDDQLDHSISCRYLAQLDRLERVCDEHAAARIRAEALRLEFCLARLGS